MNEEIIKDLYNRLKNKSINEYDLDVPLDLGLITERELKNLNINYSVKINKNRTRYFIYDDLNLIYKYKKHFYPNNKKIGFKIANDKYLTERFLKENNIKTTNSLVCFEKDYDSVYEYVVKSKKDFVIKPLNLSGGIGVFMYVNTSNFDEFWEKSFKIQKKHEVSQPAVLIQDLVEGLEVRVIVTEGYAMSATIRVPAHVKGDGLSSISELIEYKNIKRQSNPFLKQYPIKINKNMKQHLLRQNFTLNTILEKEKFCILHPVSNTVNGGENLEVTNILHENILKQAREAVLAIPGLHTSGVDVIIEHLDDQEGVILEVNKAPAFLLNYYPLIGTPQNPINFIFKSLFYEQKILNNKMKKDYLNDEIWSIMVQRYEYLFLKQRAYERSIDSLLEENNELKSRLLKYEN